MIKGSKPFLIITFLMSFGLAFYISYRAFPIFTPVDEYVKQIEAKHTKQLPFTDAHGNVLEQIIAITPTSLQLVYKIPSAEAYKVDTDSLKNVLEEQYIKPDSKVASFLEDAPCNLVLDYIFKDKNNTKLIGFSVPYSVNK